MNYFQSFRRQRTACILLAFLTLAFGPWTLDKAAAADVDATIPLPGTATVILSGGTNKIVALSTNRFYAISIPNAENVTIGLGWKFLNAVGAGDDNSLKLRVYYGNSSGYATNSAFNFTFAGNDTTPVFYVTNLNVLGYSKLRLEVANNNTNSHGTNVLLNYEIKTIRHPL